MQQDLKQMEVEGVATNQVDHLQVTSNHNFLNPFLITFIPACYIYKYSDPERTSDFVQSPPVNDQDAIGIT